jgi:hypothetical protein
VTRFPWIIVAAAAVVVAIAVTTAIILVNRSGDGEAPAASSSSDRGGPPADPRGVPASGDEAVLDDLCIEFCQTLADNDAICPTGTTNLIGCSIPLAEGIDRVNALADASAALDRSDPERYEALDDAIVNARNAYDDWSDDSSCTMIPDTNDPFWWSVNGSTEEIGRMNVLACAARATTVGYTQSSVGAVLQNMVRAG